MKRDNPNLDDFLPNSQIERDLADILWNQIYNDPIENPLPSGMVEINEEYILIPSDTKLEILAKSYRQNAYEGGFGNHYAILVAVGGVVKIGGGRIPCPKYCYATLFYSSDKHLITLDFHSEMR